MEGRKLSEPKAKTPVGLKVPGKRLWTAVLAEYDLEMHEELLLLQACRCADRLDQMATELATASLTVVNHRGDEVANPLLTESRQQAIVLSRLLASVRLPSGDEGDLSRRPQRRGASRGSYGLRAV
jgi:hypothetical protein